jgi:Sec-independent protein translocase protein TatA
MFLDPAKLMIILIVALVVLGPDKLPIVAKQMGAAWGEIRRFRERLETEVRGTFPDLPSTHQVAQAVRSPLAFLDQLADAHEREQQASGPDGASVEGASPDGASADGAEKPLSIQPSRPVTTPEEAPEAHLPESHLPESHLPEPHLPEPHLPEPHLTESAPTSVEPDTRGPVSALAGGSSNAPPRRVGRTRPWRGSEPSETNFIPDDPSMN